MGQSHDMCRYHLDFCCQSGLHQCVGHYSISLRNFLSVYLTPYLVLVLVHTIIDTESLFGL